MVNFEDEPTFEPVCERLPFSADFTEEQRAGMATRAQSLCTQAQAMLDSVSMAQQQEVQQWREASTAPISEHPVGKHIESMLHEFDVTVVKDPQQIRNLCMNVLIRKAVAGDTDMIQLRAIEMLGKVKDVSLFEERSSVLVEHMTTEEIKVRLHEKVIALRQRQQAEVVDAVNVTTVVEAVASK